MEKTKAKAQAKPKTARAIRPNAGTVAAYRSALVRLIDKMGASAAYWLEAQYKSDMAMDAATVDMEALMRRLAERWQLQFDWYAPRIAEKYAQRMQDGTDKAFRQALKDAGWAVTFRPTPAIRAALAERITENVGLIKSISEVYFGKIEKAVREGYAKGRDLKSMTDEIYRLGEVTRNRAAFIARDQASKADSVVQNVRRQELGITKAVWMHSRAGHEPRPSHVAASGKEYEIAKGMLIDGEYIQPGYLINCRCTSKSVLPF